MRFGPHDLVGKRFSSFVHPSDTAAVDAALAPRDGKLRISASYRRRIHVAGSAADASPEWLEVELRGHVAEVFGVPESLLLWETQRSHAGATDDVATPGPGVAASTGAVQARAAAAASKTNARVMTYAIHQLRNALHALDASTQLIAEGAAPPHAAAGSGGAASGAGSAVAQQDLADMLQVRASCWGRGLLRRCKGNVSHPPLPSSIFRRPAPRTSSRPTS